MVSIHDDFIVTSKINININFFKKRIVSLELQNLIEIPNVSHDSLQIVTNYFCKHKENIWALLHKTTKDKGN